ncbi:MAG: trehalose-phosphatase [Candidatus Erginobacter occultus]|nr:trehalose-phosphatase [Candidatus Erginobacter occultus]
MTHLFSDWDGVAARLAGAGQVLLCLDYDGTLSPIVRRPAAARLAGSTREILRRLAGSERVTLAVISGRGLEDVRNRVGLKGVIYAGNHGLEIRGPDLEYLNPSARRARPALRAAAKKLVRQLVAIEGAEVEDKGLTLSVHYRRVRPPDRDLVRDTVFQVIAPARSRRAVRVGEGKMVIEIRPPTPWNKGNAVNLLRREAGKSGEGKPLPVYVGDDRTDEDAFKVLKGKGITIKVGPPGVETLARYRLAGVGEVKEFLRRLDRVLPPKPVATRR